MYRLAADTLATAAGEGVTDILLRENYEHS